MNIGDNILLRDGTHITLKQGDVFTDNYYTIIVVKDNYSTKAMTIYFYPLEDFPVVDTREEFEVGSLQYMGNIKEELDEFHEKVMGLRK